MKEKLNLLWLQSSGCGGCTLSMLCAEPDDIFSRLKQSGIEILWHPSFSEASGEEILSLFDNIENGRQKLDILCIEGALVRGPGNSGRFHILAGTDRPMIEIARSLAQNAGIIIAIGSCAAFGGISSAGENITDATGLCYDGFSEGGAFGAGFRSQNGLRIINIAGCPTHPEWVLQTLAMIKENMITDEDLDIFGRPRFYADSLVHHGCARNEFYEFKASAGELSHQGCLMENLGCLGTQAHADCNIRPWNGSGSCTSGGYPCINCTAPEFEEPGRAFVETAKIGGVPTGLPTDMPKAWFIALASLSKAATPERLRKNAVSGTLINPPQTRTKVQK